MPHLEIVHYYKIITSLEKGNMLCANLNYLISNLFLYLNILKV